MRMRLGLAALGIALLAGIVLYAPYATRPAPVLPTDLSNSLRGPDSPNLSIPFEAYALTPEGLLRTQSSGGAGELGRDRPIVRTVSGAYLSRDFVFDVDVTIPAGTQDLAFVGFGRGDPNPGLDNEPGGAFLFRIHSLPDHKVIHAAAARASAGFATSVRPDEVLLRVEAIGNYIPGTTTTFRIERSGDLVTLSLPGTSAKPSVFDLRDYPNLFDERSGFLFFGNSAAGTVFSNVHVRPRG